MLHDWCRSMSTTLLRCIIPYSPIFQSAAPLRHILCKIPIFKSVVQNPGREALAVYIVMVLLLLSVRCDHLTHWWSRRDLITIAAMP